MNPTRGRPRKSVGANCLAVALAALPMQQQEIAVAVGVSQEAVSQWITGDKFPSPERVAALVALGITEDTYHAAAAEWSRSRVSKIGYKKIARAIDGIAGRL